MRLVPWLEPRLWPRPNCSSATMRRPERASARAVASPAAPAPTIATSTFPVTTAGNGSSLARRRSGRLVAGERLAFHQALLEMAAELLTRDAGLEALPARLQVDDLDRLVARA